MLGRYPTDIMNMTNRDTHDHALDDEDCSSHCPTWFILSMPFAALACVSAALLIS
jgi:hypothetical protein